MAKKSIFETLKEEELNKVQNKANEEITKDKNKLNFSDVKVPESQQDSNNDMTGSEFTKDVALSAADGAGEGAGFLLLDLPQMIANAIITKDTKIQELAMRMSKTYQKFTGASDEELAESEKQITAFVDFQNKNLKTDLGTQTKNYLKGNVLSYEPKTATGRIVNEATEFAVPSIFLSPAGARGAFAMNAAMAGTLKGGLEEVGAGQGVSTGVAVTANLAADIFALKKGNASGLSKTIVESMSKSQLDEAVKLQKLAKNSGINLKASEVLKGSVINTVERNITSIPIAQKIINKFWESRPGQLKNYIEKWGKDLGILKKNKFISQSTQSNTLKKVAINLDKSRSDIWLKSGGAKVKNKTFNSQEVDNISISFRNLIKDSNPSFVPTIKKYETLVKASKGDGQALINISHDLQLMKSSSIYRKSLGQANASEALDLAQITKMDDAVTSLLNTMPNYRKAQTAYAQFTKKWVEPIDKVKLFKNIKQGKLLTDDVEVGKFYKYIASDDVSKIDIKNLAQAFEKSGSKDEFRKLLSAYFETSINKAHIKGMEMGVSDGANIYKAMLGSGNQRGNFSELIYQLGKQNNKNVSRKDVAKVVENFAKILKASGNKVSTGSDTATKLMAQGATGKNVASDFIDGGGKGQLPVLGFISNKFFDYTSSQTAKIISKALVSPNGVEEIIRLSKTGLNDADNVQSVLKSIILATRLDDENEE